MPRLRVCHLTFDMRIGGAEQVIKNLVAGTDSSLFESSILCIEQPIGPFGQSMIEQGISVRSIPRKEGFDIRLIRKIRKYILEDRIDILHCHQYTPWAYGSLAAAFTATRIIFTEHGRFYPDRSSWKRRLVNPVLVRLSDRITAISLATRNALIEFEFIPANAIEVIYNGIHPLKVDPGRVPAIRKALEIPDGFRILGTVARLDPVKNQQMMLRAFRLVLANHPDSALVIVGDGEEMGALRQLSKDLGISERVRFTGYVERPENHLQMMDIFLLSSLTEGTSMTLLEAMSIGKPCVVTNAGGNPEIIEHGLNGLVTPSNQAEEFAKAISSLLSNPALKSEMGANAKQRFRQEFDARNMVDQYQNHYLAG